MSEYEIALEEILDLKKKFGIGSKAAWDYLKNLNEYEVLRNEVAEELVQEGVKFYEPSVRDVSVVCYHLSQVFEIPNIEDLELPGNFGKECRIIYKTFFKKYCCRVAEYQKDGLSEIVNSILEEARYVKHPLFDEDLLVHDWDDVLEFDINFSPWLEEKLYGEIAIPFSGDIELTLDQFVDSWKEGYRSLYSRAARDGFLTRIDAQRQIALHYIQTKTWHIYKVEQRIFDALQKLQIEGEDAQEEKPRTGLLGFACKLDQEFSIRLGEKIDFPKIHFSEMSSPDIQIYQILKLSENENTIAATRIFAQYVAKRNAYTRQAIIENEDWLKKKLDN